MTLALKTARENRDEPSVRSDRVRVMVVDDSLTARTVLARLIDREGDIDVVASVGSAERALFELSRTAADVILLDLEMPGMGGLQALPKLLEAREGIQVLVVSSLTEEGAEHTLSALSTGAADTMLKPRPGGFDEAYRKTLLSKIRALGASKSGAPTAPAAPVQPSRQPQRKAPRLVAIGASTGGIHALCVLLRNLPRQFVLPILVTQHLPISFMPVFARQLEIASGREAELADENTEILPGKIVVAPGDGHMVVQEKHGRLFTSLTRLPAASGCMPSVDPMFASLASNLDGHALGVVLSGMGRDGSEGARILVESGGLILVQDEASSAVWGMPGAIARAGLASEILPPDSLAQRVVACAGAAAWK